jgi:hypothetical protein
MQLRRYRTSTTSVLSGIYNYVDENGRTYHRYKEGKYLLPNDEVCPPALKREDPTEPRSG